MQRQIKKDKRLSGGHRIALWMGMGFLFLVGPVAQAVEMEDLMDQVLEDVRQESRQNIQRQVANETREVIAEDVVAPQITNASGNYKSVFKPAFIFILSMTQSGGGLTGAGSDDVGGPYNFSGSINGNLVNFTISGVSVCTASVTGSGTLSGDAAGSRFTGTLSGIDCVGAPITEKFDLIKK